MAVPTFLFPASSSDDWAPLREVMGPHKPCVQLRTASTLVRSGHQQSIACHCYYRGTGPVPLLPSTEM